jgi:hypothetical protein
MTDDAQLDADIFAGTVAALRKRAARQRGIAKDHGDGSGEAAIAFRLASEFDALADEFAREVRGPCP